MKSCGSQKTSGNSLKKDGNTRPPYQLELDMEQWTGSKSGKSTSILYIVTQLILFNFNVEYIMQNARLDESQGGIKIARRNINNFRYTAYDTTRWQKTKRNWRASWWEWKRRVKSWLKLNIQKTKIMASHHIMANKREKVEAVTDFLFSWAPKSLQMVTMTMKLKYSCSLEEKLWQT